jgi:hypothetical protein
MNQTDKPSSPAGIKPLLELLARLKKDKPKAETPGLTRNPAECADDSSDCYCCVGLTSWYALPPHL